MMRNKRFFFVGSSILVLLVILGMLGPLPAKALSRTVRQEVMKSVVQLVAADEGRGGKLTSKWTGSGTIVSADGLILTNCHVALPSAMYGDSPDWQYDVLVVSLTGRSDERPEPTYVAQVVQYSPDLDLAVVRITHYLDGRAVDPAKLKLPALEVGDSDDLEIGDKLTILGYPGIGGETITLTDGNVSGFNRERGVEGRAWIKTDATIAGGNSGGTAVDEDGKLIGVPTQGGSGSGGDVVDCRYIADTNGDGVIDEKDTCVPMGGFINALRPVNLAKPLIELASRGMTTQPKDPDPQPTPPSGKASVSRLIFAPAVTEGDQPTTVVESFPSGTDEIYLLFDYHSFQDGVAWQPVLVLNGVTHDEVWPLSTWSGGPSGMWWLSLSNDPLADGEYEFLLYYDNQVIGSASMSVGGRAQTAPTLSDIVFAGGGAEGYLLPAGIDRIDASFAYANMSRSTQWSFVWYNEGAEVYRGQGSALSSASGEASVFLSRSGGLEPGTYRLELYVGTRLAATSDGFVPGGGPTPGGDLFGPITFAEGVDRNDNPIKPHDKDEPFESGTTHVYAFWDYEGMEDGWSWTRRWYLDGETVVDVENTWEGGESGNWWVGINNGEEALPDGEYVLELLVEGQVVQSGLTVIGSGRASPTPTPKEGVDVRGQITDADTGRGIAGAVLLVLQPGITVDKFGWTEEEVYAIGEADRQGNYELDQPLERGQTYSMIIGAKGYNMLAEDDIYIPDDLKSPFELNVTLQKAK